MYRLVDQYDFAFNPEELRKPDGEWGKGGAISKVEKLVADASSLSSQATAQRRAETAWQSAIGSSRFHFADHPEYTEDLDPSAPAFGWGAYQCQAYYTGINSYLRNGHGGGAHPVSGLSATYAQIAVSVTKAFDTMGTKLDKPMTVYRVTDANAKLDPDKMSPGDVWQDKGVISTTAEPDQAAGFLDHQGERNPFIMEIDVPAGTTVLGGYQGGFETILKPGTKFKVVGKDRATFGDPKFSKTYTLPRVKLQVVPDE